MESFLDKFYFITDERFIDDKKKEGGVRRCTLDFLNLFKEKFNVEIIQLSFRKDLIFKIKYKAGLDIYDSYSISEFCKKIKHIDLSEPAVFAFNMTQTLRLTKVIKDRFKNSRVILLSHGNESTDFLHEYTRFIHSKPLLKRLTSSYKLGMFLKQEAIFREKFIDLVLTVSPIENAIEKWLNALHTFMVPRTVIIDFITMRPILGRIGFVGDFSHYPNYFAIESLAKKISENKLDNISLILIGTSEKDGQRLSKKYSFISYLGFLDESNLRKEVSTWSLFLNIAFYYSRGVSTKLGKALELGLPILSTKIANRGYVWNEGNILTGNNLNDIYSLIEEYAFDINKIEKLIIESRKAAISTPNFKDIMKDLYPIIENI